jgi:hypothetical protein
MSGHGQEPGPAPGLSALEQELRRLSPREAALDRDALFFRAGQASARTRWLWPAATAASSLAAVVLAAVVAFQPPPQAAERVVYVPVERPAPAPRPSAVTAAEERPEPAGPPSEQIPAYHRLQEHLLRWGLDGLGQPAAPAPAPETTPDVFSLYSRLSSGVPTP